MLRPFSIIFSSLMLFLTNGIALESLQLPTRNSVKVLLLNEDHELLLMRSHDPKNRSMEGEYNGRYWSLIGGAIEPSESLIEAAKREVYEETGIRKDEIKFGPIVWYGEFDLILHGYPTHIKQTFIVATTKQKKLSLANLTKFEKEVVQNLFWFSLEKIKNCEEVIYPIVLPEYLPDILIEKYPKNILEIDLAKQPKKQSPKTIGASK